MRSTSNSIMSTPCSSAASKLASVFPGATWSAPLWPTRIRPDTRGTSRSCGCRRPGRGRGSWCRSAGTAGRGARTPTARARGRHPSRTGASAAAPRAPPRAPASSLTSPDRPPRVEAGEKARLGLPEVPDPARGCAGRAAHRRCRGSGRPRAGGAGTPLSSNSSARMSGPSRAIRWSKRERESVISSSTGPPNCTTSCSAVRITSQARLGAFPQRCPRRYTPHQPFMRRCEWSVRSPSKRMKRCLPFESTARTAAPAEPLRPAVAREARVRRLDRLDLPADERAADSAGRAVDRVALGHAAEGSCPQLTRCRVSVPLPT